jgi:hypothetical protein
MAPITSRLGQSDTFKLLIAAVVAMAILTIVASILGLIKPGQMGCVTNPLDDISSTIKNAQGGLAASTNMLCLKSGEGFSDASLVNRVAGLKSLTFQCYNDASICSGAGTPPLKVDTTNVQANSDVQFKALISCTAGSGGTGDFDCKLQVRSAT